MNRLIALFFLFCSASGAAQCPYWISAGPEVYHFIRVRDGGTRQEGRIDGIRVGFDRLVRYGFYIGADYLLAQGRLRGTTATGRKLLSELTDHIVELRIGYTLQQNNVGQPFFTPFAGWGYFKEINQFFPPSPIPCTFTDTFNYFVAGFLSGKNFNPFLNIGLNFKLKFMQNAKSHVTDDPLFEDVTLLIKNEMIARLDVPITFLPYQDAAGIAFQLSPFYEYRHFGGQEGFPFNFRDTKFYLYGTRLALTFQF